MAMVGPATSKLAGAAATMLLVAVMVLTPAGAWAAHAADDGGGPSADGSSSSPAISADGRYVAFVSDADNLSDEDQNRFTNVFVRDLSTNTTTLVSRQSAGAGARGADGSSSDPAISADGRYVAFLSTASNLIPAGTRHADRHNVYVRDMVANTTRLVSVPSVRPWGDPWGPRISADGRVVAFGLERNRLLRPRADLIVVQRGARRRFVAAPPTPPSPTPPPNMPAPADEVTPTARPRAAATDVTPAPLPPSRTVAPGFTAFNLSADGWHLTFIADGGFSFRDLASRHTKRLRTWGVASDDAPLSMTGDGRIVAFNDDESGTVINTRTGRRRTLGCDRWEARCDWTLGVGSGRFRATCSGPVIAANGRSVACEGAEAGTVLDARTGIVTRSLMTGRMACVLCAVDPPVHADDLGLSADGGTIVYTDLRDGQPRDSYITDVHVLDTRTGQTTLVSRQ